MGLSPTFHQCEMFQSCVKLGDFKQAEQILKKDPNLVNSYAVNSTDFPFIEKMVIEENFSAVKFLVQHGADPNSSDHNNFTLLHAAAYIGNLLMVKFLVESGANVNIFDFSSKLPFHYATDEVLKYLQEISQPDDLNSSIEDTDETFIKIKELCIFKNYCQQEIEKNRVFILHALVSIDEFEFFKELIEKYKWDPSSLDYELNTPLHIAVICENIRFCKYLVNICSEDLIKRNINGSTPIHIILESEEAEILAQFLLHEYNKLLKENKEIFTESNFDTSILRVEKEYDHTKNEDNVPVKSRREISKQKRMFNPTKIFKKNYVDSGFSNQIQRNENSPNASNLHSSKITPKISDSFPINDTKVSKSNKTNIHTDKIDTEAKETKKKNDVKLDMSPKGMAVLELIKIFESDKKNS